MNGFGRQHTTNALGSGSVMLKGWYGDKPTTFRLTNCLHIPDARVNLISHARLDKYGIVAQLGNKKVILYKNGEPLIGGSLHDDLYRLHAVPIAAETGNEALILMVNDPKEVPDFCTA